MFAAYPAGSYISSIVSYSSPSRTPVPCCTGMARLPNGLLAVGDLNRISYADDDPQVSLIIRSIWMVYYNGTTYLLPRPSGPSSSLISRYSSASLHCTPLIPVWHGVTQASSSPIFKPSTSFSCLYASCCTPRVVTPASLSRVSPPPMVSLRASTSAVEGEGEGEGAKGGRGRGRDGAIGGGGVDGSVREEVQGAGRGR